MYVSYGTPKLNGLQSPGASEGPDAAEVSSSALEINLSKAKNRPTIQKSSPFGGHHKVSIIRSIASFVLQAIAVTVEVGPCYHSAFLLEN